MQGTLPSPPHRASARNVTIPTPPHPNFIYINPIGAGVPGEPQAPRVYIYYIYWKNRRFQTWIQIVAPKQTPELAPSISSAHFILSCCNFQTFRRFETQQEHPCLPCQLPCNCGLYVDGVIWSRVKYNSWSLSLSLYTCNLVYTQYYLRVQWHTGWESRNFQNLCTVNWC